MAIVDDLSTWAVLYVVAYVTLDATTHFSRQTLLETMRRLIAVVTLSLIAAYLMEVIFGGVARSSSVFQGPILLVVWIPVLLFSFVFSWGLYHRMLAHSQRVQMERVNIIELVAKRVDEVLAPMQKQISELQEAAKVDRASADERSSKLATAFQDLKHSVVDNIPTVDSVLFELRHENSVIDHVLRSYQRWARRAQERCGDNQSGIQQPGIPSRKGRNRRRRTRRNQLESGTGEPSATWSR